MNCTTTVIVVLIAAVGLTMMVYAVSEQRVLAWMAQGEDSDLAAVSASVEEGSSDFLSLIIS
jgi:hypothetical protein